MLKVYVISATNISGGIGDIADPYVVLYSIDKKRYRFGRTQTLKNQKDPVWDSRLNNPFLCPFTRARSIVFDIYDFDTLTKDDYVGTAEFDLLIHPTGQPVTLEIYNPKLKTERPPKIVVQVDPPTNIFPVDRSLKIHHITLSLTYEPHLTKNERTHPPELSFIAVHNSTKLLERVYGGMTTSDGLLLDNTPQHVGPGGITQVVRVNLKKCKDMMIVPLVSNKSYRGKVTVQYCGFLKEPKKDGIRVVDKKEVGCTFIKSSSVTVDDNGLYSLGSLIKIENGNYSFNEFEGQICKDNFLKFADTFGQNFSGYSQRYNISFEQVYSLRQICDFHHIDVPSEITFGLGWQGSKDLDTFALLMDNNYKVVDACTAKNPKFGHYLLHHGDTKKGVEGKDMEKITINLSKCPKDINAICIFANYSAGKLNDVQKVYMRVLASLKDEKEKELIFLPVTGKKNQNSLLFSILYRSKSGSWDIFPAARLFEAKGIEGVKAFTKEFFEISGIVEDVIEA